MQSCDRQPPWVPALADLLHAGMQRVAKEIPEQPKPTEIKFGGRFQYSGWVYPQITPGCAKLQAVKGAYASFTR